MAFFFTHRTMSEQVLSSFVKRTRSLPNFIPRRMYKFFDLVEITNKMQPCIIIYYSTVH